MLEEPVTKAERDCIAEVFALRAMLKELADELAEWVEHNYQYTKDHPAMRNRYERDMETVERARVLLAKAPSEKEPVRVDSTDIRGLKEWRSS